LHVHHADDEAWYVLEGMLRFRIGDGSQVLAGEGTRQRIAEDLQLRLVPHQDGAHETRRHTMTCQSNDQEKSPARGPRRALVAEGPVAGGRALEERSF
jgi:hypothetical protein